MPPRVVKRGGGGGAARRGGRVTRSAVNAQNPPIESADDESVNIGETSVDKSIEEENQLDESKQQSDSLDDLEAAANPDDVVPPQSKMFFIVFNGSNLRFVTC